MKGHAQHFWEMAYISALHASLTRTPMTPENAAIIAKAHADIAERTLVARMDAIEKAERAAAGYTDTGS